MKICACMGPMRGDPYCWCEMQRRGMKPTPPSQEEMDELEKVLDRIFECDEDGGQP